MNLIQVSEEITVVGVITVHTVIGKTMVESCPYYHISIKALVVEIAEHRNVDHPMVSIFIPFCWSQMTEVNEYECSVVKLENIKKGRVRNRIFKQDF